MLDITQLTAANAPHFKEPKQISATLRFQALVAAEMSVDYRAVYAANCEPMQKFLTMAENLFREIAK